MENLINETATDIINSVVNTKAANGYALRGEIASILRDMLDKAKKLDKEDDPNQMLIDFEAEKSNRVYGKGSEGDF